MLTGQALEGRRVLVVEDDYFLAADTCAWLEAAGAQVVGPAPTSELACALIEGQDIDTAVVDINLGHGPAYDVANRLKDRRVPFLFTTGYDQAAIPAEFHHAPRLQKPVSAADLLRAIRALL
jgi:DNA-binding response OmpR family regulator